VLQHSTHKELFQYAPSQYRGLFSVESFFRPKYEKEQMFLFLPRLGGKTVSLNVTGDSLQKEPDFSNSTLYIYKKNSYLVKSEIRKNIS